LVVRVLGVRLGRAGGWLHMGGFAVMLPDFVPEAGYAKYGDLDKVMALPEAERQHLGLVLDLYAGVMLLLSNVKEEDGADPEDWVTIEGRQLVLNTSIVTNEPAGEV
jgi:hypothetical protein